MNSSTTIFLGSSYEDLKAHRELLLATLAALKQEVEAMEYWEPTEFSADAISIKRVKESQIYVGIIGTRYGTITPSGKSITHLEYEAAEEAGLRRLVYLLDEESHPIVYKHVDRGASAQKLEEFKTQIRASVVGKFTSSQHLVAQVVTHLIRHLDSLGRNVRSALMKNGIAELPVSAGFTSNMQERHLNVASILRMEDNDHFSISDPLTEKTIAASVIASALRRGDFRVLEDFATFEPDVYSTISFLLRTYGIDGGAMANQIRVNRNPFAVRLLVRLAGDLKLDECAAAICELLARGATFHREIRSQNIQITPFNEAAISALKKLSGSQVVPAAKAGLELAKTHKAWAQKQALEKVLKYHE